MAESSLSLIPYNSDSHAIVLRHGSAVVRYDENSKQILLGAIPQITHAGSSHDCPHCGRPWNTEAQHAGFSDHDSAASPGETADFIDPDYFRMLHNTSDVSTRTSRSVSPQLRLEVEKDTQEFAQHEALEHTSTGSNTPKETQSHKIPIDAFSQNYFRTFFLEEKELGRGGKGVVLLVRHIIDNIDLGQFACKRVPVGDDSHFLRKVLVEAQLLQTLSHPNVVSYKHAWLENYQSNTFSPVIPCAFILQEYCNSGDLHKFIFGSNKPMTTEELKQRARGRRGSMLHTDSTVQTPRNLSFEEIFSFFKDIASGLHYLHRNGYVHRDLKPQNCLLHKSGSRLRVLVSDFGEMQSADVYRESTGNTGTVSYCAPEVLKLGSLNTLENFTQKSDVFSLGLILHLMCFGRLPYASANTAMEDEEDIDQLRIEICTWTGISGEERDRPDLPERLYKFLTLLLSVDPAKRPTTEEILQSIRAGSNLYEQLPNDMGPRLSPRQADDALYENISAEAKAPLDTVTLTRRQSGLTITSSNDQLYTEPRRPSSISDSRQLIRKKSSQSDILLRSPRSPRTDGTVLSPREQKFLLPPPKTANSPSLKIFSTCNTYDVLRLLTFAVKAYLCLATCSPMTTKTWISWPLLLLAAYELIRPNEPITTLLCAFCFHVVVIFTTRTTGLLCMLEPHPQQ